MAARHVPEDQKKAAACRGVVAFEDEASFWLDGSLHWTWAPVGQQPRVDTYGKRKTGHVFGAVTIEARPRFAYQFAPIFNCGTFLAFLKKLVHRRRRNLFDHRQRPVPPLNEEAKVWLKKNRHQIELWRLPPYSPEFNGIEGVWKTTKRATTHNRFFETVEDRDAALTATFESFIARPSLIAGHVARFLRSRT